ncbi:MAG: hypothetical protein M3490_08855 [Chloroflexota bacterium]|nr:hypothetical protein [Chloroflexota bacterium]
MNVRDMAVTPLVLCSMGAIERGPQAQSGHRIIEIAPWLSADGVEVMIYGSWYGRLDEVAVLLAIRTLDAGKTRREVDRAGPGRQWGPCSRAGVAAVRR